MAIMTNGASVVKKDGRLLVANQKICFAHGLQRALVDVIYKKREFAKNQPEFKDEFSDSDSSENDKILIKCSPLLMLKQFYKVKNCWKE